MMWMAVSEKDAAISRCVAVLLPYTRYVPHVPKTSILEIIFMLAYSNLYDNVVIRTPKILRWGGHTAVVYS